MIEKVTLQNLIDSFARDNHIPKEQADAFVRAFFQVIKEGLQQDQLVKIKGFGTFKVIDVEPRESVNVNTGVRFQIPGYQKLVFIPDAELKQQVNLPFADFDTIVLNENVTLDKLQNENINNIAMEEIKKEPLEEGQQNENTKREDAQEDLQEVAQEENVAEGVSSENQMEEEMEEEVTETTEEPTPEEEVLKEEMPDEETSAEIGHKPEASKQQGLYRTTCSTRKEKDIHRDKRRKRLNVLIGVIIFLVLLICIIVAYGLIANNKSVLKGARPQSKAVVTNVDSAAILREDSIRKVSIEREARTRDSLAGLERMEVQKVAKASQTLLKDKEKAPKDKVVATSKSDVKGTRITGYMTTHVMKQGDNMYTIAKKYLGSKDNAKYIIEYNQFKDPNVVPIGTRIRIPKLSK